MNRLRLGHLNVRSLLSGFVDFKTHILDNKYNIIAVTETWLTDNTSQDLIQINNYTLILKNRTNNRGGGIGIYIHNSLKFENIEIEGLNTCEHLWLRISINSKNITFGVIYRPPNTAGNDFLNQFEDVLLTIVPTSDEIFLVGDFNINLLDFSNSCVNKLNHLFESYGLKQIIDKPTRITLTSATLIDLIITTNSNMVSRSDVIDVDRISDHSLVYCDIQMEVEKIQPEFRYYRDFKRFDLEHFEYDLNSIPFNNIYDISSLNLKVDFINEIINVLINRHIPLKKIKLTKPKAPWLTDNIKYLQKLRSKALIRFKKTGKSEHREYYKMLRNFTTKAIMNEKKAYLQHKIRSENNLKTLWKDLKELNVYISQRKNTFPPSLGSANEINNFFVNSITTNNNADAELLDFYLNNTLKPFASKFKFKEVTEFDVSKVILSIKSKAAGVDDYNIDFLKLFCPKIIPYITHIINTSFKQRSFPDLWKKQKVLPLPKIKNPSELNDLRPISVLPVMSKIMEKIMDSQIRGYISNYNILPKYQSGFRAGYSCSTALLNIIDDVISSIDQNQLVTLVLLDYSKAFDTINHKLLLAILHYIGFEEEGIALIENYLSNRTQQVFCHGQKSNELHIEHGVPQGSILGPLLFTVYISNLPSVVEYCKIHTYADDTQIYLTFSKEDINQANTLINQDLDKLVNYSQQHSLNINPKKSVVMLFGRAKVRNSLEKQVDIRIRDTKLQIQKVSKNLGLLIDSSLKFHEHINKSIARAVANLKLIYANRSLLDKNLKKMLSDALVLSHFNYCDVVYDSCIDVATSNRIQRIQNCCIRFIYGIKRRERVTHKLKDLRWLNMKDRRLYHSLVLYHGIVKNRKPDYLYEKVKFRCHTHSRNTRFKHLISIKMHNTKQFEKSFTYSIAKKYNSLPDKFKTLPLRSFKIKIKNYLLFDQNSES